MGRAASRRNVEKTIRANEELIESADREVEKLRTERKRSEKVIARAKKSLAKTSRRNGGG